MLRTAIGWLVLLATRRRLRIHPSLGGLIAAIRGVETPALNGDDGRADIGR